MPHTQRIAAKLPVVTIVTAFLSACALSTAHAATEGLPFKVVDYDATYTLHTDGSYTAQIHEVTSPLSQFGVQKFAQVHKEFPAKLATLMVTKAYTLDPSGKMYTVPTDQIFTRTLPVAANAPEFSDAKSITVVFPHVAVGDDLISDWRMDFKKPYFPNEVSITHTVPYFLQADHVHLVVHAPASMKLHWHGTGGYQVTRTVSGNTQTITATFAQPHPEPIQANAVSFYQVSPSFLLSTFPDWQAIGDAYWHYAEPAQKVTPQVQALADKIAGDKTGKAAVQALYDWTVHHIRWVGVETGLSGYKPYPADTTLTQRYGDCKAAAALLVALLHARHIDAQPALLGAGTDFDLPEVADLQRLNHAIVYVPQYHLYLDATSGYAPMGTIPLPDTHQPVILVGEHSQVARIPGDGPDASQMTGMEKVSINSDGAMQAKETLQLRGYGAWMWKDILARVPTSEYPALMHQALAQAGLMAQSGTLTSNPTHSLAEPFTLEATWSTGPAVPLTAGSRIHFHYGLNTASLRTLVARLTSATVKHPAFMPYGSAQWSSEVSLPKGFAWKVKAQDRQIKNAAGAFSEKVQLLSPQTLRVTYGMQLAHLIYTPEEYPDLYKLVSEGYAITQEGFWVEN